MHNKSVLSVFLKQIFNKFTLNLRTCLTDKTNDDYQSYLTIEDNLKKIPLLYSLKKCFTSDTFLEDMGSCILHCLKLLLKHSLKLIFRFMYNQRLHIVTVEILLLCFIGYPL